MTALQRIAATYLVPVVMLDDAVRAIDTARALLAGGVDVMEITLRTAAGLDAIEAVSRQCPDMLVGVGTVLSQEACREAIARGARFIVSPGYDDAIVEYCLANGVDVLPGCVTPTEIMRAIQAGLRVVKFFPATVYGGIKAIKALGAPFGGMKFVPTGGVGLANLTDYVVPEVFAVGGGWLCERAAIRNGAYDEITRQCAESVKIVSTLRGRS